MYLCIYILYVHQPFCCIIGIDPFPNGTRMDVCMATEVEHPALMELVVHNRATRAPWCTALNLPSSKLT